MESPTNNQTSAAHKDSAGKTHFPVENLNFEQAMSELETIVRNLETGSTSLENSIAAYERGIALKKHCENKLRQAQSRIEKISIEEQKQEQNSDVAEAGKTGKNSGIESGTETALGEF